MLLRDEFSIALLALAIVDVNDVLVAEPIKLSLLSVLDVLK